MPKVNVAAADLADLLGVAGRRDAELRRVFKEQILRRQQKLELPHLSRNASLLTLKTEIAQGLVPLTNLVKKAIDPREEVKVKTNTDEWFSLMVFLSWLNEHLGAFKALVRSSTPEPDPETLLQLFRLLEQLNELHEKSSSWEEGKRATGIKQLTDGTRMQIRGIQGDLLKLVDCLAFDIFLSNNQHRREQAQQAPHSTLTVMQDAYGREPATLTVLQDAYGRQKARVGTLRLALISLSEQYYAQSLTDQARALFASHLRKCLGTLSSLSNLYKSLDWLLRNEVPFKQEEIKTFLVPESVLIQSLILLLDPVRAALEAARSAAPPAAAAQPPSSAAAICNDAPPPARMPIAGTLFRVNHQHAVPPETPPPHPK
ncbi:MAG: hypothetical protein COV52_06655 [Gammaproteobacteria bacterium CG11_big_fil_rev_8_21_14_0_20_46_22]|nr:MAG: hypothetical protein COW05_00700 [Gammaproteobacteria bacterium CG12_big_fil_rev_8_21_14_0_65_46_12]PIR10919.1 MAG: hypothetical protein COV52_06655 [Gammaproteobacteria bacterium CG11_big_fil_rev_8_21_14_0_20_46_22]